MQIKIKEVLKNKIQKLLNVFIDFVFKHFFKKKKQIDDEFLQFF